MPTSIVRLILLLPFALGAPGFAAEVAEPGLFQTVDRTLRATTGHDKRNDMNMLDLLKALPGGVPPADDDAEAVNQAYNSGRHNALEYKNYVPAEGTTSFTNTAKECGEAKQKSCSPANFGGRTMCGRAVAEMIKCMAPSLGAGDGCQGGCGNGKDYVNCKNGQMEKCGYAKISPTDPRCNSAGAVLSYAQSPTARGSIYGHVEFVCGNNRFCSVYKEPHDRPWPRYPADTCWFPTTAGARSNP
jgi:hypothetical protein